MGIKFLNFHFWLFKVRNGYHFGPCWPGYEFVGANLAFALNQWGLGERKVRPYKKYPRNPCNCHHKKYKGIVIADPAEFINMVK